MAGRFPPPPPAVGPGRTSPAAHLQYLTTIRNAVIGSRTKKAALAQHGDISYFVTLLNTPLHDAHALEIRSQAATILGSIAHGASTVTLLVLLRAQAPQALIRALDELLTTTTTATSDGSSDNPGASLILASPTSDPLKALESVIRALRVLMLTVADELNASARWGVGSGWGSKGAALTVSSVPAGARLHSSASALEPLWAEERSSGAHPSAAEVDEDERQVRLLGRRAIAHCFHPSNLPLLLAPLMLVPSEHSQNMSGSGTLVPADQGGSGAGAANLFPSSTKVRLNNITEMIFFLLSACLAIPGPGPSSSAQTAEGGQTPSASSTPSTAVSPEAELYQRRAYMLNFRASLSPWHRHTSSATHTASTSASARHSRAARNAPDEGMQAELLHSPSRSGSLDRERDRRRSLQQPHDPKGKMPVSVAAGSKQGGKMDEDDEEGDAAVPGSLLKSRAPETGLLDVLIEAVEGSLTKTREAALWTIGELVRDCPPAAHRFILCSTEAGEQTTTMLLRFREDPDVDIRLAAFCCMSNIVKVHNFGSNTSEYVLAALIELLDPTAPPLSVLGAAAAAAASAASTSSAAHASSTTSAATGSSSSASRTAFENVRNQLLGISPTSRDPAASASRNSAHASSSAPASPSAPVVLGSGREIDVQVQACFALARLLTDHVDLQYVSHERFGIVGRVGALVDASWKEVKKRLVVGTGEEVGGGGGALGGLGSGVAPMLVAASGGRLLQNAAPLPALSEGVIRLLEASLTVLATVSFHADEIRQAIIETSSPALLPIVASCLTFPAPTSPAFPGIRIAACRLIRALSRSVATLRTSLVDAGVGEKLLVLLHDERERHEVRLEVVAALCNMVLKHSPTHELVLQSRGVERLVALLDSGAASASASTSASADGSMVINVLWALKNLACRATLEVKRTVGEAIGWERLLRLAGETDAMIQEQALNLIRNLAAVDEADIEMTVSSIGLERLLDLLEHVIWTRRGAGASLASSSTAAGAGAGSGYGRDRAGEEGSVLVLVQAANILVNLATGSRELRLALLQRPNLLDAILFFMNHPREEVRVAGVWCASNLTYRFEPSYGHGSQHVPQSDFSDEDDIGLEAVKRLRSFNFEMRVRELLDREEALNVRDRAKVLLSALEVAT
ncbi:hypothetical protein OC834_003934 [Tilletia horrida]|nr:hypothetical protein OC834_003934 [Tilletia horrida]